MSIKGPTCLVFGLASLCFVSGHVCTSTLQHDFDKLSTQDDQTAWLPSCFTEICQDVSTLLDVWCLCAQSSHPNGFAVTASSDSPPFEQRAKSPQPFSTYIRAVQDLLNCAAVKAGEIAPICTKSTVVSRDCAKYVRGALCRRGKERPVVGFPTHFPVNPSRF